MTAVSFLVLIVLALIIWTILHKLLSKIFKMALESVGAIALLLIIHYVFNVAIPVNMPTILVAILFGIPGIGTLLLINFFGMI